jgi:ketosteroid isomerase-like protein
MSPENVEIARRAARAFVQRDLEGWVELFDPRAELLLPRNLLEGGSYRGHEGIRRAFADAYEMWDEFRVDFESVQTSDDQVLFLGRATNAGKGDAPTVEYESAWLFRLRAGKIVYFRPFQSHREAVEAAGLGA